MQARCVHGRGGAVYAGCTHAHVSACAYVCVGRVRGLAGAHFFARVAACMGFTLILSVKNFSKEVISMILSSTGLAQSMVKVMAFFLAFWGAAFLPTVSGAILLGLAVQGAKRGRALGTGGLMSALAAWGG